MDEYVLTQGAGGAAYNNCVFRVTPNRLSENILGYSSVCDRQRHHGGVDNLPGLDPAFQLQSRGIVNENRRDIVGVRPRESGRSLPGGNIVVNDRGEGTRSRSGYHLAIEESAPNARAISSLDQDYFVGHIEVGVRSNVTPRTAYRSDDDISRQPTCGCVRRGIDGESLVADPVDCEISSGIAAEDCRKVLFPGLDAIKL